MKCSGENVILRGILRVVYRFLYISCNIAEILINFWTTKYLCHSPCFLCSPEDPHIGCFCRHDAACNEYHHDTRHWPQTARRSPCSTADQRDSGHPGHRQDRCSSWSPSPSHTHTSSPSWDSIGYTASG